MGFFSAAGDAFRERRSISSVGVARQVFAMDEFDQTVSYDEPEPMREAVEVQQTNVPPKALSYWKLSWNSLTLMHP